MLYHMCPKSTWDDCKATNTPYYPPTYHQDGFIHLTGDPKLLIQVANHFYQNEKGDWIVLLIDENRLSSKVVFEPAMPVGDRPSAGIGITAQQNKVDTGLGEEEQQLFPHLYGTINVEAVTGYLPIVRSDDGAFLSIPGLAEES